MSEIWVAFPYIDLDRPRSIVSKGHLLDAGGGRKAVTFNDCNSMRMLDEINERVFSSQGDALRYCAKYMREKADIFAAESERQLVAAAAAEIVVVT